MYNHNSTFNLKNQAIFLKDIRSDGKEQPWKQKKIYNSLLENSYFNIGSSQKAFRASCCATRLQFKVIDNNGNSGVKRVMKLVSGSFCQLRLCAMCNWRRNMKIFAQLTKVVEEVKKREYKFIFLTLTCQNITGVDLIPTMDNLYYAYKRLFNLKKVNTIAKGYFRALEITHDTQRIITKAMYKKAKTYYDNKFLKVGDINPNFNMYHPHFHVMIAVNKSYYANKDYYITQAEWVAMWQQVLGVTYTPIVNIKIIRNTNQGGVREVAKYTVKDTDFIIKEDEQLTDTTVAILDKALANRRLVAYGGIMKEIHKELNLTEDVTADVIITGEEEKIEVSTDILSFDWNVGYKNYTLERIIKIDNDTSNMNGSTANK